MATGGSLTSRFFLRVNITVEFLPVALTQGSGVGHGRSASKSTRDTISFYIFIFSTSLDSPRRSYFYQLCSFQGACDSTRHKLTKKKYREEKSRHVAKKNVDVHWQPPPPSPSHSTGWRARPGSPPSRPPHGDGSGNAGEGADEGGGSGHGAASRRWTRRRRRSQRRGGKCGGDGGMAARRRRGRREAVGGGDYGSGHGGGD